VEMLSSEDNPEEPATTHRDIPFGRELYVEREDFMALLHYLVGDARQIADRVANVVKAGGGGNLVRLGDWCHGNLCAGEIPRAVNQKF